MGEHHAGTTFCDWLLYHADGHRRLAIGHSGRAGCCRLRDVPWRHVCTDDQTLAVAAVGCCGGVGD